MKNYEGIPTGVLSALKVVGENIRIARKRRKFSATKLAKLAGTTRETLRRIETGNPGVSFGFVVSVLWILGLSDDIKNLAAPEKDILGLTLETARARTSKPGKDFDNDF